MGVIQTLAFLTALAAPQEELRGTGWVNSRELSLDRLRGKVVILFFYEEDCPRCRGTIPDRIKLRKSMEGKPVVFIAVNSGNPNSAVEGYAKETGLDWPILVDERNETEKQFGFTISLQNIYQVVMIDPAGKAQRISADNTAIANRVQDALPSAKMIFDGITVPAKLQAAARDIELGLFEPAVGQIAALAQKPSEDAAKAMYEKLKPIAEKGLDAAKALQAEGKKYAAYLEFSRVATWLGKTDYEKAATAALGELKKDKEIQDELKAQGMLTQARGLLASAKKADQANGRAALDAIRKKYPDTRAAKEAAAVR